MKSLMSISTLARVLAALCLLGALAGCGGDTSTNCKAATPGLKCAP